MPFLFFGASFVLHLIWENLQAPLYADFSDQFGRHLWICFVATATGDMLFSAILYAALAIAHRDAFWVGKARPYAHPATWVLPCLIGVLLATSFELWAIYVNHRWTYGRMPIIPVLGVGWTPVLQMLVVPALVLLICRRSLHRSRET